MDALELIKRIEEMEEMVSKRGNIDILYQSGWHDACRKITSTIKQMEKEKWEKAWSEFDINKPSKIADNFFDDK